jgi:hypothetical protein
MRFLQTFFFKKNKKNKKIEKIEKIEKKIKVNNY